MHGCIFTSRQYLNCYAQSSNNISLLPTVTIAMSHGYPDNLGVYKTTSGTKSGSISPSSNQYNIPIINIKQDAGSPGDVLSRSLDIKKQLSQSFQGTLGGISKPQSRRNSAYHVKSDPDDDNDQDNDDDDQGNERKRRDNINERIQELLTLLPSECFLDNGQEEFEHESVAGLKGTGTKDGKPNKGQILTKSVDYIHQLQNIIDENNRKEVELLLKLQTLKLEAQGKVNVPVSIGTTSAELALSEIGVGPHSEEYFKRVLLEATGSKRSD